METPKCKFPTWIGLCKKEANKSGYCLEHEKVKCAKCGTQATDLCDYAYSMSVCGMPLCTKCKKEHKHYIKYNQLKKKENEFRRLFKQKKVFKLR